MTTKTLDLSALFPTFESTYAHARRMGADRPLAQRFGLADVLGEIETEIAKRVDAVKAEHAAEKEALRVRHASELATERARTRAAQAAASLPSATRYSVTDRGDVYDRVADRTALYGSTFFARLGASQLRDGRTYPASLVWVSGRR